jgi:hypothetical protein
MHGLVHFSCNLLGNMNIYSMNAIKMNKHDKGLMELLRIIGLAKLISLSSSLVVHVLLTRTVVPQGSMTLM